MEAKLTIDYKFGHRVVMRNSRLVGFIEEGETLEEFSERIQGRKPKRGRPIEGQNKKVYVKKTDFTYGVEDKTLIGTATLI